MRQGSEKKIIFWFGAGISIPSKMPSGTQLTRAWLEMLLPAGEADYLLHNYYVRNQYAIGKALPRLEKVIDDSVQIYGNEVLSLLNIFKNVAANKMHKLISSCIVKQRSYSITTNFDHAVESINYIPVHTPEKFNVNENDWGLIKLHGCIKSSKDLLGATVSSLQKGLPNYIQNKLTLLLEEPDNTFVFVGYSGSDFFDVTSFFDKRRAKGDFFASKAIWIQYGNNLATGEEPKLDAGPIVITKSFDEGNVLVLQGDPFSLIMKILDDYSAKPTTSTFYDDIVKQGWEAAWGSEFKPDERLRNLYAAKIYASFGIGHESLKHIVFYDIAKEYQPLYLNALRDSCYYKKEFFIRKKMPRKFLSENYRQYLVSSRLSGRKIRSFLLYLFVIMFIKLKTQKIKKYPRESIAWIILESGLQFRELSMPWSRSIISRWLYFPFEILSKKLVNMIFCLYQEMIGNNDQWDISPHMKATAFRLNDFITNPYFSNDSCVERWLLMPKCPLDSGDMTGDLYTETDSFLGYANHARNDALNMFCQLDVGFLGLKNNDNNKAWMHYIDSALRESLLYSKHIADFAGVAKCYFLLAKIAKTKRRKVLYKKLSKRYWLIIKIQEEYISMPNTPA